MGKVLSLCVEKKTSKSPGMKPVVSIIMGSTSDLPVMEKAAELLNEFKIPFEINALSAHRTPDVVEEFATAAADRGIKVIIAAAGMAAHLPGVIAAFTAIPVIGVPVNASLDGLDALLSTVQMPGGIPVATVAIDGAANAGILAAQILSVSDDALAERLSALKEEMRLGVIEKDKKLREELGRLGNG
jgi:5-(carboxyamino)imidazole ribonucleotide mutase